jgi:hypothetical protein
VKVNKDRASASGAWNDAAVAVGLEPEILIQAVPLSADEARGLSTTLRRFATNCDRLAELKEGVRAPEARN